MAESSVAASQDLGALNGQNKLTNGVVNGTSEDHSGSPKNKKKDRDKDRDRHKSSHKDKDRHSSSGYKSSHKDKDREKSDREKDRYKSSSGDKHKGSSDREKELVSDKEKSRSYSDKHRDGDKDKYKSPNSNDRYKDKEREKDKDRSKDKSRNDKERFDKVRSKDKDRSDKDRCKEKERGEKDKEHSDKDKSKDKERSDIERNKDKERSDKDRSRDKDRNERDKSRDKERSEKSKDDRHRSGSERKDHSSSSKSSHKDKHREKSRDKPRDEKKEAVAEVKQEPLEVSGNYNATDTSRDFVDSSYKNQDGGGSASEEDTKLVIEETSLPTSSLEDTRQDSYMKQEPYSDDDDVPLSARKRVKQESHDEDEDDVPLAARKKVKKEEVESDDDVPLASRKKQQKKKRKQYGSDDESDDDFKPQKTKKAKVKKEKTPSSPTKKGSISDTSQMKSPSKRVKKESEEEKHVWKWWEEKKIDDGRKWTFLEHKGVVFADPYVPLPSNIKMKYDNKVISLSLEAEEVAGFYARMLDHEYVTKEQFNKNFFKDFRKSMTPSERELITDLKKCDFKQMHAYFVEKNEERKNRTKEEKKALKEKNEELIKEYGWCIIDGHKQRIANFKVEPPGLFRGRGDHPKMGMLKRRIVPEDIIINCSKNSQIPKPPQGHKWKEVRNDNMVTWLASWTENVQGQTKYVMMNAASKLKGEKDWQKYETARRLHQIVDRIREQYKLDWKSKEMRIRQRSVALYFIDKLALRAGNEKDEDQADTVGCCSLRVEHITLHDEKDGKECVVAFDFLGKDSIRYYNEVPVEKRVFKNLKLFMENKAPGDDLFDRLNTQIMNKHLNELMEGLTAKVFRTYNASITLQQQLSKLTFGDDDVPAKVLSYNRANRDVAILCNHQRSVPKTFNQSMANLQKKIDDKKELIEDAEKELRSLKKQAKSSGSVSEKAMVDKKKKHVERLNEQLRKLEIQATDKQENKQIALGTSKLNYLDPRISVAWCKKYGVPIEKVYNKTQRLKFQWAIEMATEDFDFTAPPDSTFVASQNDTTNEDDEDDEYDEDDS